MRGATVMATIAAVSMFLGLARWPSIHWALADRYGSATPAAREAIDAVFAGLNLFLGNFVGEFLGEIALNAFFVLVGWAALRSRPGRWMGPGGIAVGIAGWLGAFRNVTSYVAPIAEANNYVLPLWLIVLGIVLIRWKAPAGAGQADGLPAA